jgi:hypothetical protein
MMKSPPKFPRPGALPPTTEPAAPVTVARPTATATVGPAQGASGTWHAVELVLELGAGKRPSVEDALALARRAFDAFAPVEGASDRRAFQEMRASRRGAGGVVDSRIVGVEAKTTWPVRPDAAAMESLCAALAAAGYRVTLRERRVCSQRGCSSDAFCDWHRADAVPPGWFVADICGKHDFKACTRCGSVYTLLATNVAGQSPSVHCEVCSQVLVEWGGSKRWDALLVKRSEWTAQ